MLIAPIYVRVGDGARGLCFTATSYTGSAQLVRVWAVELPPNGHQPLHEHEHPYVVVAVTEGKDGLLIYGGDKAHDAHCRKCGSLLYSVVRDGAWVHVALGTLVDAPTIRTQRHIFVGSKAPWFTITDDLPQHEGHMVRS